MGNAASDGGTGAWEYALQFTSAPAGSGAPSALSSVSLGLSSWGAPGNYTVTLQLSGAGSAGEPTGSALASANFSVYLQSASDPQFETLPLDPALWVLAPNTTYDLVLSAPPSDSGFIGWWGNASASLSTFQGFSVAALHQTSGGFSWDPANDLSWYPSVLVEATAGPR